MKKKTKLTWTCEWSGREIIKAGDGYVVALPRKIQGAGRPMLQDPAVVHYEEAYPPRGRWSWSQSLSHFATRKKWQRLKMLVEDGLLTVEGATRLAAKLKITLYRPISEFLEADRGTGLVSRLPPPPPVPRVFPEPCDFMAEHPSPKK